MTQLENFAKACAFVIFADGRIDEAELQAAYSLLQKYGLDLVQGKELIKKQLDLFIDKSEDQGADQDLNLGSLEFEDFDSFELLKDLALLTTADGELSTAEVDLIHLLAEAFSLDGRLASLALLSAVKTQPQLHLNLD